MIVVSDDLLEIASIKNATLSEDSIVLNLTINTSLACYAEARDLQICRTAPTQGSCKLTPFSASSSFCQNLTVDEPSQNVPFYNLSAGSTYCFVVLIKSPSRHRVLDGYTTDRGTSDGLTTPGTGTYVDIIISS